MRILTRSNKTVLIATGGPGSGGHCPRVGVAGGAAKFADDYHNTVRTRKSLITKLFSL